MIKKEIGNATLYCGDSNEVLEQLTDIDSCVTDPPYGLSFMGKSWDYDVPQKELWEKVFASLKSGSHLLSFFGSRTYHRGAIPIEDAGFEIRDQLMWIYGSGFPKSHNIGKAVDKLQGNKREVVGVLEKFYWQGQLAYIGGGFSSGVHNIMEPAIARLPVVFGQKYTKSHKANDLLKAEGGFSIKNGTEFYDIFKILLYDKNRFLEASYAATNVIHDNVGSATRVVRSIIRD